jgi:phenylacetate-CoA ligase
MAYPLFFNERIETMPLEQICTMQEEKLRRQMAYNREHSLFYRRRFNADGIQPGDIRTLDDLAKLPFTTKEDLRDSQLEQPPLGTHAAASMEQVIRIHSSSGTTGRPSYVGITRHDRDNWTESIARVYWTEGVRPNTILAMGFGLSFFVGGVPLQDAVEHIGATFIPIGTGASDRLITSIQHLGANQLTCTPSYATYLAEYVRSKFYMEPRQLGLQRIQVGAEPGGGIPEVRKRLEEDWGTFVTEGIGNADVIPVYAGECDERAGMHFVAPDLVILEVIDPDTGAVLPLDRPEVRGELVFTHIDRECVPLVRFRTRDQVIAWTDKCACGRTGIRLRCVGRTDDMLILLGVNVFPSAIKDVVMALRPRTTGEIQIVLDRPGPAVEPPLKIQVEHGADVSNLAEFKREIEGLLRDKLIFAANVELLPPGALPRYEMKAKLIHKAYEPAN